MELVGWMKKAKSDKSQGLKWQKTKFQQSNKTSKEPKTYILHLN
ncbi:hypothetical protein HanPSC8_Chr12g0508321 [Helianthus annuus]|nr:hypothetical protein HanPSC8_Chr12g0508321 [Helianthus annuus]